MVKYKKSIKESSIIFDDLMGTWRDECQLEELGMTAHKYYKRGLVTADRFNEGSWLMHDSFLMPYVVSDEALKEHFTPLPVIPQAVGEYIEDAKASQSLTGFTIIATPSP